MHGVRGYRFRSQKHFKCSLPKRTPSKLFHVNYINSLNNIYQHQIRTNGFLNSRTHFNHFSTNIDPQSFRNQQQNINTSSKDKDTLSSIYKYCAKARFTDALDVLKSHPKQEFTTPILRALHKKERFSEALSLYGICNAAKIHPDQEGYSLLFKLERRWKRYLHIWKHYNDMKRYNIVPNATIVNTLAQVCLETNNAGMATHLFNEVKNNTWQIPLNDIDVNYFIKTFAASEQIVHCFEVLEFMREKDLELAISALVAIATACFKINSLYGKNLHEFIVNNGIQIDYQLKVCIIRVYARFHPPSTVLDMLVRNTPATKKEVSFAYMVHAALGGSIHPAAHEIFKEFIDFASFHEFIRKFCGTFSQPRPPVNDGIMKLLASHDNMKGLNIFFRGIEKNTDNWNTMMSLQLQRSDYVAVLDLFDRMPTKPNMKTFAQIRPALANVARVPIDQEWKNPVISYMLSAFNNNTTTLDIKNMYEAVQEANQESPLEEI